jgi:hypothetical protein
LAAVSPVLAISTRSVGVRPNFTTGRLDWHQISSLVCSGPLTTSLDANWISMQSSEKAYQVLPDFSPVRWVERLPPAPLNVWFSRSPSVALSP